MNRYLRFVALLLACAPSFVLAEPEAKGGQQAGFPEQAIRLSVVSPDRQRLETPVAAYVNADGREVLLIGAVHVAEKSYYARLNQLFKQCDLLLFEMVGGEKTQRHEELKRRIDRGKPLGGLTPEEAREWDDMERLQHSDTGVLMKLLGGMYQSMSKALNLQSQKDGIDYSPAHFVHADMTLEEFNEAQARRGESLGTLILKSVVSSLNPEKKAPQINELKLIKDLLTGNNAGVKNELMRLLADPSSRDEMEDSVILEGRNVKCCEIFDQWRGKGYVKIGIFYGAAHLPGLHEEMVKRGYRLREVQWLPAWSTAGD